MRKWVFASGLSPLNRTPYLSRTPFKRIRPSLAPNLLLALYVFGIRIPYRCDLYVRDVLLLPLSGRIIILLLLLKHTSTTYGVAASTAHPLSYGMLWCMENENDEKLADPWSLLGPHLLRRSVQGCMDVQNIRPHVPDLPDHLRTLPAWRPRNANVSS